jgi:hypothetical protein
MKKQASLHAQQMKTRLKDLGHDISLGHCYEAIAAMQDFESWNHAKVHTPLEDMTFTTYQGRKLVPRLAELQHMGLVEPAGIRKCELTGRPVTAWKATGNKIDPEIEYQQEPEHRKKHRYKLYEALLLLGPMTAPELEQKMNKSEFPEYYQGKNK